MPSLHSPIDTGTATGDGSRQERACLLTGKQGYLSSLPLYARKPHVAQVHYPSKSSFGSRVWSHVVGDVSQDFLSGAKQILSAIYLQYYANVAVWYFHHYGRSFLSTYTLAYSEAFATYPEKIPTTIRGYCLPETPMLKRANISQVAGGIPLLTQEISNLRLLEDWSTYWAKYHSAPLLICLHRLGLKTGYRATQIFSLARKVCSYNKKGDIFYSLDSCWLHTCLLISKWQLGAERATCPLP